MGYILLGVKVAYKFGSLHIGDIVLGLDSNARHEEIQKMLVVYLIFLLDLLSVILHKVLSGFALTAFDTVVGCGQKHIVMNHGSGY